MPKVAMRAEVASAIKDIFNAPYRLEAENRLSRMVERYRKNAPRLAEWAAENIPELSEISDEWETGKVYLNMKYERPAKSVIYRKEVA